MTGYAPLLQHVLLVTAFIIAQAGAHEAPHVHLSNLRSAGGATLEDALSLAAQERRTGHPERALKVLARRSAAEPGVLLERALAFKAAGRPRRAKHALDHLLKTSPDADAFIARARLNRQLGHHGAALADYANACLIRPNVTGYFERTTLLSTLGRHAEAAQTASDGLNTVGEAVTLRRQLVNALAAAGQPARAAVALWPLTKDARSVPDLLQLASLHALAGNPADALLSQTRALEAARDRFARRSTPLNAHALVRALLANDQEAAAHELAGRYALAMPELIALVSGTEASQ